MSSSTPHATADHAGTHWTDASEHHGFHPHVTPLWIYFAVFGALMVLTVATVGLYRLDPGHTLVHLGFSPHLAHPINMILSMMIATVKASLVAMIFMHLWWDNKYYLLLFLGSLIFLGVFIVVTLFDTERRGDVYEYRAIPKELKAQFYEAKGVHPDVYDPVRAAAAHAAHGGGDAHATEGPATEHPTEGPHIEPTPAAAPAASPAAGH